MLHAIALPCYTEPLVNIVKPDRPNIFYRNVTCKMTVELIENYIINDNPLPQYAFGPLEKKRLKELPT